MFCDLRGAEETVSQPLFRTFGACSLTTFYPRLAPWAVFLRRSAAAIVTLGPLHVQSGGCDTVSEALRLHHFLRIFFQLRSAALATLGRATACALVHLV